MTVSEIKLSSQFKTQTTRAIIAIVFFAIIYVLILLIACAFTALCAYGGLWIIAADPSWITLVLGVGIASVGFLILIFLVKFIFKSHKIDRSHLYEIKKVDEPEIFRLIEDIVKVVGTNFPKKVYLSTDVNAAVFYDSSFWSMFFPIQKNLQIGLGLVNSVTRSELKAILAHEFGHFSQSTMKVGSYVYNVNQIIHNMLFDNKSYDELIQKWASISGFVSIFVIFAVRINQGIQWLLAKLYGVVNKAYMALSREMEFHADEIAAHVTGYESLKNSLLRLSFSDHCFNSVLSFYDGKIVDNQRSSNVYQEHAYVLNFLAKDGEIKLVNGLPDVTFESLNKYNKSKLNIKNQWASHPSTEERVERLEATKIVAKEVDNRPANTFFKHIEGVQESLTNLIFKDVIYEGKVSPLNSEIFKNEFEKQLLDGSFSKIYNSYYDIKNPTFFEIELVAHTPERFVMDDLFSTENVELVYTGIALKNDIETLKQILENVMEVKTLDYAGTKYNRKEIGTLFVQLKQELEAVNEAIKENDIRIFQFFKALEATKNDHPKLSLLYKAFFDYDAGYESNLELYTQILQALDFINVQTPFEQIGINFSKIEGSENKIKVVMEDLLKDARFSEIITNEIRENLELYCARKWKYFGGEIYYDKHMEIMFKALHHYAFVISRGYFVIKRDLLKYQEGLLSG